MARRTAYSKSAIEIEGVAQTIRALKDFEPDLYKEMGKSIRKSMRLLRDTARRRRPEGDYRVSTRLTDKRGPKGSVTAGVPGMTVDQYLSQTSWTPEQRSVIFEFAQSADRPGMKAAIRSFDQRFGTPGRFLWAAYDDIGAYVEDDIERAIRDAEATLQSNLDSGVYG